MDVGQQQGTWTQLSLFERVEGRTGPAVYEEWQASTALNRERALTSDLMASHRVRNAPWQARSFSASSCRGGQPGFLAATPAVTTAEHFPYSPLTVPTNPLLRRAIVDPPRSGLPLSSNAPAATAVGPANEYGSGGLLPACRGGAVFPHPLASLSAADAHAYPPPRLTTAGYYDSRPLNWQLV